MSPWHLGESHFGASGQIGVEHAAEARPTCSLDERPPAEHPALTTTICHRNPNSRLTAVRPDALEMRPGRQSQCGTDDDGAGPFWIICVRPAAPFGRPRHIPGAGSHASG